MSAIISRGLFTVACILSASLVQAQEWATLKGRFVYDGKAPTPAAVDTSKDAKCSVKLTEEKVLVDDKGGLANAVIMLRTKNAKVHPDYEKTAKDDFVLDNKDCRFVPHVGIVRTSQKVLLKNSDPTGHNSNISPIKNAPVNPLLPAGAEPIVYQFKDEEALPVKVGCNIHPWMGAWLVARKDPYAAVSAPDGTFEIKNLPAGTELEFRLWHESPGYLKDAAYKGGKADSKGAMKIKLKAGETDLGDIKVKGSIFK
jgi:hypothetical protein